MRRFSFLFSLLILHIASASLAQTLPCGDRPQYLDNPWTIPDWCLEEVIDDPEQGALGFSALEVGDDGTLYATQPLLGQVVALKKPSENALPSDIGVIAQGLTYPNGLAYHEGALYISGGPHIYRWREGQIETLVDDLPSGPGFWTGGLAVGPDERLYVGIGAACYKCLADDPDRGVILSFDLEGGDKQVVGTGLRHPADVAFLGDSLWTVDSAPMNPTVAGADELNRVETGADFGWPACRELTTEIVPEEARDCAGTTTPALMFPPGSAPAALAAYSSDLFPRLTDSLLVVLKGSVNEPMMEGYALAAVMFDETDSPTGYRLLIPGQSEEDRQQFTLQEYNYRGSGFWPARPLGVAVSPEGWVYVSVSGGRILAMRPR